MSSSKVNLRFDIPPEPLFDKFLQVYKKKGFHIEEADRIELKVKIEKSSALSFLFGLGSKVIFADFDETENGSIVYLKVRGSSAFLLEVEDILESLEIQIKKSYAKNSIKPQKEVEKIIIRDRVRIPCSYCGSLVDNTKTRCPHCGGELRWK